MEGSKITTFGMVTVSLDMKIVNIFCFYNLSAFEPPLHLRTWCNFFGQ